METGTERCPVLSFKSYVNKLNPKCNMFFQRPKPRIKSTDAVWYENAVVGKNSISKMMKRISVDAKLSIIYPNHCIRATCISALDAAGYEARDICTVSGHKNADSIRHYSRTSIGRKREMSTELSALIPSHGTSTITMAKKRHVEQPEESDESEKENNNIVAVIDKNTTNKPCIHRLF